MLLATGLAALLRSYVAEHSRHNSYTGEMAKWRTNVYDDGRKKDVSFLGASARGRPSIKQAMQCVMQSSKNQHNQAE